MDKFIISSTGLSMNYMPHYVAKELGFFEDVDLEVSSSVPTPWTNVLKEIDSGEAHAVEGGIWVPLIYFNRVKNYPAFSTIASRCPLVLLSREPVPAFSWKLLEGKKVLIAGGDGASHGLFILGCAFYSGADMSKITVVNNFLASTLVELFQGGFGDIISLQADMAAQLVTSGKGYIMADLTIHGGPVPWSVYYGTREFLEHPGNLAGRFTLALQKATTWVLDHDAADCEEIIRKNWPKVDVSYAINVINMFRREGMWTQSVRIDEGILDRWQNFLVYGNVIDAPLPYQSVVDARPYMYAEQNITGKPRC